MSIHDRALTISDRISSTKSNGISKESFLEWSEEVVSPSQGVTIFEVYKYFVATATPDVEICDTTKLNGPSGICPQHIGIT